MKADGLHHFQSLFGNSLHGGVFLDKTPRNRGKIVDGGK